MTRNYINELVRLCLNLAELADTHGEEDSELDILRELGLGYRAFSGTLRRGVIEIINLQGCTAYIYDFLIAFSMFEHLNVAIDCIHVFIM